MESAEFNTPAGTSRYNPEAEFSTEASPNWHYTTEREIEESEYRFREMVRSAKKKLLKETI